MFNKSLEVLQIISNAGYDAYIVGGFVRDLILDKKSSDVDICTNAPMSFLQEAFENVISFYEYYGVITILYKNITIQITHFRKEFDYKNNKPKKIEFVNKLEEDIIRRDFTINSICLDKDMKIIDLLNAKADINSKVIKCIRKAEISLMEDKIRIIRALRFSIVFKFTLDKDIKNFILNNPNLINEIPKTVLLDELNKIFVSGNIKYAYKLLKSLKLIHILHLEKMNKIMHIKDLLGIYAVLDYDKYFNFKKHELKLIKEIKKYLELDFNDITNLYEIDLYVLNAVYDIKNLNKKEFYKRYNNLIIKNQNDIDLNDEIINLLIDNKISVKKELKNIAYLINTKKLINDKNTIYNYLKKRIN